MGFGGDSGGGGGGEVSMGMMAWRGSWNSRVGGKKIEEKEWVFAMAH